MLGSLWAVSTAVITFYLTNYLCHQAINNTWFYPLYMQGIAFFKLFCTMYDFILVAGGE